MNLEDRITEAIDLYQWHKRDQHSKASEELAAGNYSAAATACHRAYQFRLRAIALQEVSEDD